MMNKALSSFALAACFTSLSIAQDSTSIDLYDMSLEDLLNMDITVASKKAISQKESPGIVSVISEEEIISSGARDLMDVLRLVPGIHFNSDVQGQVGISIRGNWGLEGKVLVMIDNQELNENLYGSVMFGGHYDVTQIKRIEIIRGPGSSIYGGYAELGVIHIITKGSRDYQGFNANYTFGTMNRHAVSLGAGDSIGDLHFDIKAFYSQSQRSDQNITDWYEGEASMDGTSDLSALNLNVGAQFKGLKFRMIYDDHQTESINMFGEVSEEPGTPVDFSSLLSELKYDWEVSEKLTITPKVNFQHFAPWVTDEDPHAYYDAVDDWTYDNAFKLSANRMTGNLSATYDINEDINILVGTEYLTETANNHLRDESEAYYYNGKDELTLNQFSAFGQFMWMNDIVNVVTGGRFMNHSTAGTAYAPRLALTKEIGNFHTKALLSQAFRAPSFENINGSVDDDGNPTITPEETTVFEIELGYLLNEKTQLTANIFDITVQNPIIYYYDPNTEIENYENYNQTGSRGTEVELRHKNSWGFLTFNYSLQSAASKVDAFLYEVPGYENLSLGMPQHMLKLNATYKIKENLTANISGTWLSERYAINTVEYDVDDNEILVYDKNEAVLLLNLFVNYKDLLTDGLNLGLGVNNLLNQKNSFIQPYANYLSPLPDRSTEFVARLSYDFTK
jgi:outer membrane receptor for ferrienterochelin and colicin